VTDQSDQIAAIVPRQVDDHHSMLFTPVFDDHIPGPDRFKTNGLIVIIKLQCMRVGVYFIQIMVKINA